MQETSDSFRGGLVRAIAEKLSYMYKGDVGYLGRGYSRNRLKGGHIRPTLTY